MQMQTSHRVFWILFVVLTEWQDTKEKTNNYTRALHTSACKAFWEMITGDIECIKYIVNQALAKKNVTADDDAKRKML